MANAKELRAIALRYFEAWNNHDLEKLQLLLSNDIVLVDWDIKCFGKSQVIEAYKLIFIKNPNISADLVDLRVTDNTLFAQLVISTEHNNLKVLDILNVDRSTGLISEIQAFRQ